MYDIPTLSPHLALTVPLTRFQVFAGVDASGQEREFAGNQAPANAAIT